MENQHYIKEESEVELPAPSSSCEIWIKEEPKDDCSDYEKEREEESYHVQNIVVKQEAGNRFGGIKDSIQELYRDDPEDIVIDAAPPFHEVKTWGLQFECYHCGETRDEKVQLKLHMKTIHIPLLEKGLPAKSKYKVSIEKPTLRVVSMDVSGSMVSELSIGDSSTEPMDPTNEINTTMCILDGTFFKLIPHKCSETVLKASCVLCEPLFTQVKGYGRSSSNFLSHLRRAHGEESVNMYRTHATSIKSSKQINNIHRLDRRSRHSRTNNQEIFDNNILNFIINSMLPLRTVEDPYFKKIFDDLRISSRGLKVLSCRSMTRKMETLFNEKMTILKEKLADAKYVCTTADIWSGQRRSCLGITVHWIVESTLERKSASLACRRFRNIHTGERIADLISQIHNDFGLTPSKIRASLQTTVAILLRPLGITLYIKTFVRKAAILNGASMIVNLNPKQIALGQQPFPSRPFCPIA